ncbi:MAG: SDR family NAD(P)-dependent oxidoreductase [Anaerolineales bacterium]|jgi:NAD(P)-dependent dehydrogenase (short-subunit alcohol dehydrogenase family)
MLIETGKLTRRSLAGKIALITGAGGGIGYEAARSLLWLGCKVVIAEINSKTGRQAAQQLNQEFDPGAALFVKTDVGDEGSVKKLARRAQKTFGGVDIVLNNATVATLGAVKDVDIEAWDASYRVNLRGPVLLARAFIPGMLTRDWGVFVCVSSTGGAYMGAYESFKAAQVHLGATLSEEFENTAVSAFTIGPGFVPTQTALSSIPKLAALMGKSEEEMFEVVKPYTISIEAAGAGFAAAVALAPRYRGQEISSTQALADAGIDLSASGQAAGGRSLSPEQFEQALVLCQSARTTLAEQSAAWQELSVFERQWLTRTFRQKASLPVDEWLRLLERLEAALEEQDSTALGMIHAPLDRLADYYGHLHEMAKGYVKDPDQRDEQLAIVREWQEDIEQLHSLLK